MLVVEKARELDDEYHEQVLAVLPHVESKIFRFVSDRRFSGCSHTDFDPWVADNVGRIATTLGLTVGEENENSQGGLIFKRKDELPNHKWALKRNIYFSSGPISVNFEGAAVSSKIKTLELVMAEQFMAPIIRDSALVYNQLTAQRRAASAAILARNFSHNIGSHVMPRTGVKSIAARLDELLYEAGVTRNYKNEDVRTEMIQGVKDRLDDYIRQKSDFLAEIPTEPGSSFSTLSLYRDVIIPFISNTAIMDCLAANEGVRYRKWHDCELRIRLLVKRGMDANAIPREVNATPNCACNACNGNEDSKPEKHHPFSMPYGLRCSAGMDKEMSLRIEGEADDLLVAWPGVLGQFALYGIIENLVRNAAKHNRDEVSQAESTGVCITLLVIDDPNDSDHYTLQIYDNVTNPLCAVKHDGASLPLHKYIQTWLDKAITNLDGTTRTEAWGLAEIMICANLLTGKTTFTNENGHGNKLVNAKSIIMKGPIGASSDKHLVYEMPLLKARQALFVGKTLASKLITKSYSVGAWKRKGIVILHSAKNLWQYLKETNPGASAFQFAIIEDDQATEMESGEAPEEWRRRMPHRIIRVAAKGGTSHGDLVVSDLWQGMSKAAFSDASALMTHLWAIWCKRWLTSSKASGIVSLSLDMGNDKADNALKAAWESNVSQFNNTAQNEILSMRLPGSSLDAPKESDCVVMFDRHGSGQLSVDNCQQYSYVAFDKSSADFINIFQPRFPHTKSESWSFPYELFEAGMLRVLVLDERIAERAIVPVIRGETGISHSIPILLGKEHASERDPCMWHIAHAARTTIVTHLICGGDKDINWNDKPDMNNCSFRMKALHGLSYAKAFMRKDAYKETCPTAVLDLRKNGLTLTIYRTAPGLSMEIMKASDFDVILVHQGILDTIKETRDIDILESLKTACPWVVVESGRGMPPGVQNGNERFLPFSAMDRCFGEKRIAKFMLTKRLMELTRAKKEDRT